MSSYIFTDIIPHWHALQFIAACKKGFDIYCGKPLKVCRVLPNDTAFELRQQGAFHLVKPDGGIRLLIGMS